MTSTEALEPAVDFWRAGAPPVKPDRLAREIAGGGEAVPAIRALLREGQHALEEGFARGVPARDLIHGRARLVDQIIVAAWRYHLADAHRDCFALLAVGGYGRAELHPGSDVDITILVPANASDAWRGQVEGFVAFLWDIGLELGHSVRTLEDCSREAAADITVVTNLTESRLLDGPQTMFDALREVIAQERIWPDRDFFLAKYAEQQARHLKYDDTAYQLEPNVKEGPGGLRDIQTIGWVAKRHFRADSLYELVTHRFLTEDEYQSLTAGQEYLWQVRFVLHTLAGRREDRLLFDHQVRLAEEFGYRDDNHNLAVEQFMQRYYRTITRLNRLNEVLLQLFRENILFPDHGEPPVPVNARFQVRRGFLEVRDEGVFRRSPFALLEMFLLLEQDQRLKGVRASTIRLARRYRDLIDEDFRNDIRARSLFMEILRQPRGITHELRRMNRYGILARYIPAFRQVVGRMQFDLFHAYTVDQHLLFVVRNIRRMAVPEFAHEYPLCSRIMEAIPKPELLYIAALFHDIGKGRGGDHSKLGALDAEGFCLHHGLSVYDTRLVVWLVRNHLLMSMTAQRRDISDPEEIHEFARRVRNGSRLDHLFLLTVADMRGTNPELLNSWKFTLLTELYQATREALQRGLENPIDPAEAIEDNQARALDTLRAAGYEDLRIEPLWATFPEDYFLRNAPDEIAWETRCILGAGDRSQPLVRIHKGQDRGGTTLFIYMADRDYLFGLITAVLNQLGLTVQEARIHSTTDGRALDAYVVLEEDGEPIDDDYRVREIQQTLTHALQQPDESMFRVTRRVPRRARAFSTPTEVHFTHDETNQRTALELITGDRPGLLSTVGRVFQQQGVRLITAKISTVGERAEDVFFVTDRQDRPLLDARQCKALAAALRRALDADD
ncbi:MAG TPA: [protein-PII] uridylyltransferase [Gammaproteobacteria bacterium]|nr:[protein-PII] uridylyltransferase [Gammaproteobacteria bacterium]